MEMDGNVEYLFAEIQLNEGPLPSCIEYTQIINRGNQLIFIRE